MIESTIARSNADGSHDALYRALDLQSVTAIVRSDGPAPLLLIATKQPWSAAQPRFERAGWKASPDGELLELQYAGPARGTWYLTGRDGLIVLSAHAPTATEARDGRRGANRDLATLIANADGVAAAALTSTTDECVRGFGLGYSPARGGGEISLLVDGPPDAARAKPNGTGTGTGLGYKYDRPAARAERDRVVVPYTKVRARNAAQLPMGDIIGGTSHFEYRC